MPTQQPSTPLLSAMVRARYSLFVYLQPWDLPEAEDIPVALSRYRLPSHHLHLRRSLLPHPLSCVPSDIMAVLRSPWLVVLPN